MPGSSSNSSCGPWTSEGLLYYNNIVPKLSKSKVGTWHNLGFAAKFCLKRPYIWCTFQKSCWRDNIRPYKRGTVPPKWDGWELCNNVVFEWRGIKTTYGTVIDLASRRLPVPPPKTCYSQVKISHGSQVWCAEWLPGVHYLELVCMISQSIDLEGIS